MSPEKIKYIQVSDWWLVEQAIKISSKPEITDLSIIVTGTGFFNKHVPRIKRNLLDQHSLIKISYNRGTD